MQPDARLIEHIKNARKPRADLGRQPDPLRFSTRKRAALAIEREIAESNLNEKLQARLNFAHHLNRNHSLLRAYVEILDVTRGSLGRQLTELVNVQFAPTSIFDCDRKNLRFKPRATAYLARLTRHKCANAIASKLTFGFLIETLHLRHQAFERSRRLAGTTIAAEGRLN